MKEKKVEMEEREIIEKELSSLLATTIQLEDELNSID